MHKFKSILVASGAFKDVYTPMEASSIIAGICKDFLPQAEVSTAPMVDGGEFSSDLLVARTRAEKITVDGIVSPEGNIDSSFFLRLKDGSAFIASSDILRMSQEKEKYKNPLFLTSYGFGQLIKSAIKYGFTNIVLGLGGTGTVDGGIGAGQALGMNFLNSEGHELHPKKGKYFAGCDLGSISMVSANDSPLYDTITVTTLCDADTPLECIGIPLAQKISHRYFPDYYEIEKVLFSDLVKYSGIIFRQLNATYIHYPDKETEFIKRPYFGVAGGLLITLSFLFKTHEMLGIDYFSNMLNMERSIRENELIITGEGKLDNSLSGKTPVGVSRLAGKMGKTLLYIAGDIEQSFKTGFNGFIKKKLPPQFRREGISVLASLHPYYETLSLPEAYDELVEYYKKENRRAISYALSQFFLDKV